MIQSFHSSVFIQEKKASKCPETYTLMFVAALFVMVKNWKRPKCPLTDGQVNKLVHSHRGILLRGKKKGTTEARNYMNESQNNYAN